MTGDARRRKVCVVTGSRADYGLLEPVMRVFRDDPAFALQVAATGSHFSLEHGDTWREIEADGFAVDARVETLLACDTASGVAKSMGLGVIGFADAYARLAPDLVVVLGDRYEILAAAQAAVVARIPLAHLCGGDLTEGAFDDAIRHCLTKMAALHFPTNADAAARVRQLGEDPRRIFTVGSTGLDRLKRLPLLSREALAADLGIQFREKNILLTFHPETLADTPAPEQLRQVLAGLDALGDDVGVIATRPNADNEGRALTALLDAWAARRARVSVFSSLGQRRYLSLAAQADAVVGNSSSGLYEIPSLGKPTVNIGDRQKGRLRAASVLDCPARAGAVAAAVRRAFGLDCAGVVNPYGDGDAARRIHAVIAGLADWGGLVRKRFHDLPGGGL